MTWIYVSCVSVMCTYTLIHTRSTRDSHEMLEACIIGCGRISIEARNRQINNRVMMKTDVVMELYSKMGFLNVHIDCLRIVSTMAGT